jgi:hypothetical protein
MHIWARWQNMGLDVDYSGINANGNRRDVKQGYEDWNLFQVGGIIFF